MACGVMLVCYLKEMGAQFLGGSFQWAAAHVTPRLPQTWRNKTHKIKYTMSQSATDKNFISL